MSDISTPTSSITIIVLLVLGVPVVAATVVLTWHGLRGSNPGPAAAMLLKLVHLILARWHR
jgi:hypothetical protein